LMQDYALKYDPVPIIFKQGNNYHILRALNFLGKKYTDKLNDILTKIRAAQNDDGGWPWLGRWGFDEKIPSSITDTAYIIPTLIDTGTNTFPEELERALTFLLETQREDGGWSESPQLGKTMSASWTWFSVDHSVTWITGLVITALTKAGHPPDTPNIRKARRFLKGLQNREGGWPSHTGLEESESTDMWAMEDVISALLATGEKKSSKTIKKAEDAILIHRDRWKEPVENPLGVFFMLGYDKEHQYVDECIHYLLENQKEDGGWGYYSIWRSSPDQTVHWLEILLKLGVRTR